VLEREPSQPV